MLIIRNVNKKILSPHQHIVRLFCDIGSLEGGVKTIIGTNPDLVFLYKHCTVFSGKFAIVTGHMHVILINLHLFE